MKSYTIAVASLLGATALSTSALASPTPTSPDPVAAVLNGKPILDLRGRWEEVEQSNLIRDAEAYTLRTQLGWQTASYDGFAGLIEVSNVSRLAAEHYNTTVNGKTQYPTVADPALTRLNRAQLTWAPGKVLSVTLGRQRILLDDQRFVGNVNWRQNEQTFDAGRIDAAFGPWSGVYAYIGHVNRVFGDSQSWNARSHVANLSLKVAPTLSLTGFYYGLEFHNHLAAAKAASTATRGIKAAGATTVGSWKLTYAGTYARQSPYGVNPAHYSATFTEMDAAASYGLATFKLEGESLSGDGVHAFATPLATLHGFLGWDDVFLTTPAKGLKELSEAVTLRSPWKRPWLLSDEATVRHLEFETEHGRANLGEEWDMQNLAKLTPKLSLLAKYADYKGVAGSPSRRKLWVSLEYIY
ncbi:MAG: alginate export family protein [Pseudomonadota bacterium]|jgi:hypothetical protein